MKKIPMLLLLCVLTWASATGLESFQAELRTLLPPNARAGVAVGHFTPDAETVAFVGNPAFNKETLFEYGSVTKVFTAVVLAELAQEGVIDPEHSINQLLPKNVRGEKWRGVTLVDLATHAAGLPLSPPNMSALYLLRWMDAAYERFDERMLYEAAEQVRLGPVGALNSYSNFGFGLLGELLARATGTPYKTLVEARIFKPLGMTNATMTGWHSERAAPPLSRNGDAVGFWNWDALAGAGAARGSVTDALRFLRASAEACRSSGTLAEANCRAQQATDVRVTRYAAQGLGWIRSKGPAGAIVWHNGGTGGFSSFFGFNARTGEGLVVLANVADVYNELTFESLEFLAEPE